MEYNETQISILEAALELFSTKGYKAATTREIAFQADVNELTLFRNFGNKEGILRSVILFGFDPDGMKNSIMVDLTGDLEADLFNMVSRMRANIRKRDKIFALMLREMASNEIVREELSVIPMIMKEFMIEWLGEVLGNRVRDNVDLETAGVFFASYYLRSEMMRIMLGKDPFHEVDDDRLKETTRIFLHGVLKREVDA